MTLLPFQMNVCGRVRLLLFLTFDIRSIISSRCVFNALITVQSNLCGLKAPLVTELGVILDSFSKSS